MGISGYVSAQGWGKTDCSFTELSNWYYQLISCIRWHDKRKHVSQQSLLPGPLTGWKNWHVTHILIHHIPYRTHISKYSSVFFLKLKKEPQTSELQHDWSWHTGLSLTLEQPYIVYVHLSTLRLLSMPVRCRLWFCLQAVSQKLAGQNPPERMETGNTIYNLAFLKVKGRVVFLEF